MPELSLPNWITAEGPAGDIALSTRLRLARNLKGEWFPLRQDQEAADRVIQHVGDALPKDGAYRVVRMSELTAVGRQVLVEEHLISPLLALRAAGAVALRADAGISIMINEEDHLRIQALLSGLQCPEAWKIADGVDDALGASLEYAFSEEWGYLAASPANVGTGLRCSVMMHLPGLVLAGQAAQLFANLAQMGVVVRGLHGEGSAAVGNLFQISNQVSLGLAEEEIAQSLQAIGRQIVDRERSAREWLYSNRRPLIEDRAARAYGLLTNARLMPSGEAAGLLSDLRLGIDLKVLPHLDPALFNELLVRTRPACLQREPAVGEAEATARDALRATLIRQRIKEAEKQRP
ncbi:MAG TPA: protein arginine kinase [Bacillota bacterium]|nr:protein arginine kinase [Bacillota bacterium]